MSHSAYGVSAKLADGITFLSGHVNDLADILGAAGMVLAGRWVTGLTAATGATLASAQAAKEKALADGAAAEAARLRLGVEALTATEAARAAEATLAQAQAERDAALAANERRQASLQAAQASAESAAAIEMEVAALQAATAAARARLAAAPTIQAAAEAEAELSAALQAEADFQWRAEAASKAHSDALGRQVAVTVEAGEAANALAAAEQRLAVAEAEAGAASSRAATAQGAARASMEAAAASAGKAGLAMKAVNAVLLAPLAWEAGQMVGDFLSEKFEKFRLAGVALAQGIVELGVVWDVFSGKLTAAQGKEELKKISQGFADVAQDATDAGRKALESAKQQQEAVQKVAEAQKEALDKSQAKLKEATTLIDAEFARQTAAGDLALNTRLAQIKASGDAENVQAQKSAVAEREALAARLGASAEYGQRRLSAITALLGTQEQIEKQGEVVRKASEQASLQARIDAYGDLAKAYAKVVDDLQGQWQREMALFAQGNEGIKALAIGHEAEILALRRQGMTEREKLRSLEVERDAAVAKFKAEAAKGEQADEKELNRLYGDAKKLVNEVATAKVSGSKLSFEKNAEIRKGEGLLNDLYEAQKGALDKVNAQHKANTDVLLPSLEQAKSKLAEMNKALGDMDAQLAKSKELKIQLDQSSVSAAQSIINELTAPATKTITIQTVNAGGGRRAGAPGQGARRPDPRLRQRRQAARLRRRRHRARDAGAGRVHRQQGRDSPDAAPAGSHQQGRVHAAGVCGGRQGRRRGGPCVGVERAGAKGG